MGERSPNEGLSLIDQALCTARALVSYMPIEFDELLEGELAKLRYFAEHGPLVDTWYRLVKTDGEEGYVLATERGGEFRSSLPPGQEAPITFAASGKRPAFTWLKELAQEFHTISQAVLAQADLEQKVAQDLLESDDKLSRLDSAISACEPNYNENFLRSFAESTQDAWWATPPKSPKRFEDNALDQYTQFIKQLRNAFGADAVLFASFTAAIEICNRSTKAVSDKAEQLGTYLRYANMIRSSKPDPRWLLHMMASVAIQESFDRQVFAIADEARDFVDERIEAGLNASTLNEHHDNLYRALPPCWVARELYRVASNYPANANSLTEVDRKRCHRICTLLDEKIVRLWYPFVVQLQDLGGAAWRDHRVMLRQAREKGGESAAAAAANELIEEHFFYPRALLPDLLDNI